MAKGEKGKWGIQIEKVNCLIEFMIKNKAGTVPHHHAI